MKFWFHFILGVLFVSSVQAQVTPGAGTLAGSSVAAPAPIASPAFTGTASFVNITASGTITPSQTGGIVGTTTNNSPNAGSVGEIIKSVLASGSAVSLGNGVTSTVTSINITAGDWDVWGMVDIANSATTASLTQAGVSATAATNGTQDQTTTLSTIYVGVGNTLTYSTPHITLQLGSTTTYYLVATGYFSAGTETAYGTIIARRRR